MLLVTWVVLIIYAVRQHQRRTRQMPAPRMQSVPTLMQKATKRHVLCRSDRPPLFTSFLKNLALMLDAFGEVPELYIALQSKSTTLSKAYTLVTCYIRTLAQFNEGHSGKPTKTAEEPCATGAI